MSLRAAEVVRGDALVEPSADFDRCCRQPDSDSGRHSPIGTKCSSRRLQICLSTVRLADSFQPPSFSELARTYRPRSGIRFAGATEAEIVLDHGRNGRSATSLALGRRWAEHASAHELATMVSGSFDDLSPNAASGPVRSFRRRLSRRRVARLARVLRPQHKGARMRLGALARHRWRIQAVSSKGSLGDLEERWNTKRINSRTSRHN